MKAPIRRVALAEWACGGLALIAALWPLIQGLSPMGAAGVRTRFLLTDDPGRVGEAVWVVSLALLPFGFCLALSLWGLRRFFQLSREDSRFRVESVTAMRRASVWALAAAGLFLAGRLGGEWMAGSILGQPREGVSAAVWAGPLFLAGFSGLLSSFAATLEHGLAIQAENEGFV